MSYFMQKIIYFHKNMLMTLRLINKCPLNLNLKMTMIFFYQNKITYHK